MNKTGKTHALLTILIIACLILPIIGSVNAQTLTKPSVPDFTIKYVDYSYDIPPTYGIAQYTGETVVTKHGEHIDNRSVEITIKNQPFTPFNDSRGNTINRFFDVRYKGSYGDTWTTLCAGQTQMAILEGETIHKTTYIQYGYAIQNYTAQYTKITYKLTPYSGQMDFQVQALEGYTAQTYYDAFLYRTYIGFTFYGESSDWSNTQTISFPDGNLTAAGNTDPTATQTPDSTPSPSVPEFSIISLLPLFVVVFLAALLVKSKTRFLG
jgi:hypothetical protein